MYQCKQCGRQSPGQSESGVCLECAPPSVPAVTREQGKVRCTNCGQSFANTSRSPQVECPQCGRTVHLSAAPASAGPSNTMLGQVVGATVAAADGVFQKGVEFERKRVVAWLRAQEDGDTPGGALYIADCLQRGEHLR